MLVYGMIATVYAGIAVGIRLQWLWLCCHSDLVKFAFAFFQNVCRSLLLFLMFVAGTRSSSGTCWWHYRWWMLGGCVSVMAIPSAIVEPNTFDTICDEYGSVSHRSMLVLLVWTVGIVA